MVPVIPSNRRDGKSSFGDLVSYISVRDEEKAEYTFQKVNRQELSGEVTKHNQFIRLVEYACKEKSGDLSSVEKVFDDGSFQENFHGVTCFHNCLYVETAADEMQQTAERAKFKRANTDPVFHYILSWPESECPRPEQIQDCVIYSLASLGLKGHQYLSAIHTDTDNLHVHVAVNRVHPETLRLNGLSFHIDKLHKACRELEIKHGFSPTNGCFVQNENKQVIRRSTWDKEHLSAWRAPHKQTLREYVQTTVVENISLSEVSSWAQLHQELARAGLYLTVKDESVSVHDGWDSTRKPVLFSAQDTVFNLSGLTKTLGIYSPVAQDVFSQVSYVGRYDPEKIFTPPKPYRMKEKYSLPDYVQEHVLPELAKLDAHRSQHSTDDVHALFARQGLYLQMVNNDLVICDAYDPKRTPMRAESAHPILHQRVLSGLKGGWHPAPRDMFTRVQPERQYKPQGMVREYLSAAERGRQFFGPGPHGAVRQELFADKSSLHGYAVATCRRRIDKLIRQGDFTWQKVHETFAEAGLLLVPQYKGLVVKDAYHPEMTPVRASQIHPDLTLTRAEPQAGPFERVAENIFQRVSPQSQYRQDLSVRDKQLRMTRRIERAQERTALRERYNVFRSEWKRPDLKVKERFADIAAEARASKERVRQNTRDPLIRKLQYHVVELHRLQAQLALKDELKAERAQLSADGKLNPPGWRQWVEQQALTGDKAALSALRGIAYREKRGKREPVTTERMAVIKFDPGSAPVTVKQEELRKELYRDGSVLYTHAKSGIPICRDTGETLSIVRNKEGNIPVAAVSNVLFDRITEQFGLSGDDQRLINIIGQATAQHNLSHQGEGRKLTHKEADNVRIREELRVQRGHARARLEQDEGREIQRQQNLATNRRKEGPSNKR